MHGLAGIHSPTYEIIPVKRSELTDNLVWYFFVIHIPDKFKQKFCGINLLTRITLIRVVIDGVT